jgi:hypothetical protein
MLKLHDIDQTRFRKDQIIAYYKARHDNTVLSMAIGSPVNKHILLAYKTEEDRDAAIARLDIYFGVEP